ncbi:MAG: hypothetical protein RSC75_12960, partial [Bacteroidales bacterium]
MLLLRDEPERRPRATQCSLPKNPTVVRGRTLGCSRTNNALLAKKLRVRREQSSKEECLLFA